MWRIEIPTGWGAGDANGRLTVRWVMDGASVVERSCVNRCDVRYPDGSMFDVAASSYDAFMGRWSRLLSAPFADFAGVRDGRRVLDVGAGTGALTAELASRLGAGNVAAGDPSPPFAAALRQRFPGLEVVEAPAESLPFPASSF